MGRRAAAIDAGSEGDSSAIGRAAAPTPMLPPRRDNIKDEEVKEMRAGLNGIHFPVTTDARAGAVDDKDGCMPFIATVIGAAIPLYSCLTNVGMAGLRKKARTE